MELKTMLDGGLTKFQRGYRGAPYSMPMILGTFLRNYSYS